MKIRPKKIFSLAKLGGKLSWKMLRLIRNPMDISPIFEIDEFLSHDSFRYSVETCRNIDEVRILMDQRYLAPGPYDLNELAKLPEGTLGHGFAKHMRHHKMDIVFYPPLKSNEINDLNYLRLRSRETHDIHHYILGFKPHHFGEMQISAFYLKQFNSPLSAFLMAAGILVGLIKKPYLMNELIEAYYQGWQMGKECKPILAVKWEELWEVPVSEVREMLGINVELETFEQKTQKQIEKQALLNCENYFSPKAEA